MDGYYSSWSDWTNCTELGVCTRRGVCREPLYGGEPCSTIGTDLEEAFCPSWATKFRFGRISSSGSVSMSLNYSVSHIRVSPKICEQLYWIMWAVWIWAAASSELWVLFVLSFSLWAEVKYEGCYRIDDVSFSERSYTEFSIPPCMCVTHCKMNYPEFPFAGSFNEWVGCLQGWEWAECAGTGVGVTPVCQGTPNTPNVIWTAQGQRDILRDL